MSKKTAYAIDSIVIAYYDIFYPLYNNNNNKAPYLGQSYLLHCFCTKKKSSCTGFLLKGSLLCMQYNTMKELQLVGNWVTHSTLSV